MFYVVFNDRFTGYVVQNDVWRGGEDAYYVNNDIPGKFTTREAALEAIKEKCHVKDDC